MLQYEESRHAPRGIVSIMRTEKTQLRIGWSPRYMDRPRILHCDRLPEEVISCESIWNISGILSLVTSFTEQSNPVGNSLALGCMPTVSHFATLPHCNGCSGPHLQLFNRALPLDRVFVILRAMSF